MKDLAINPVLAERIQLLAQEPPHALLVHGSKWMGKKSLCLYLANIIKEQNQDSLIYTVDRLEDSRHILIEQIKDLKPLLSSKRKGYLIIIINDADIMTTDAQNSILKILEEPPAKVLFILNSSKPDKLLPTIRSRLFKVPAISPEQSQMQELGQKLGQGNFTDDQIDKFIKLAKGRVGLLSQLLGASNNSQAQEALEDAKEIIAQKPYQRMSKLDVLSKDIDSLNIILGMIVIIAHHAILNSTAQTYKSWLRVIESTNMAIDQIDKGVTAKLVLSKLFLVL